MDIYHPWTKYEIAALRDEERRIRARSAMLAREARGARDGGLDMAVPPKSISWLERFRRRGRVAERASAQSV